jgi:hypothetical protein
MGGANSEKQTEERAASPPSVSAGTWKSWSDFMEVVRTREKFRGDVSAFIETAKQTVGPSTAKRFSATLERELASTFEDRLDTAFQHVVEELKAVTGWQPALVPICPICQTRCKADSASALECGHIYCRSCVHTLLKPSPDDEDDDDEEFHCAVCRAWSITSQRVFL